MRTEFLNNTLFRIYNTSSAFLDFAFPIPAKSAPENWLDAALKYIFSIKNARFCLITEQQKNQIDMWLNQNIPGKKVIWENNREDADYIYLQQNLSRLPGKDFQKKRNHISRFIRIYQNSWSFKTFPEEPIKQDILTVGQQWFSEKNDSDNKDLRTELEIIKNAVENAELLHITGGVLYINHEPCAMTLASPISSEILDIHFEKAIGSAVKNGAYSVINQQFSNYSDSYRYINREEDLGIEGLRKAKLSYKPDIILEKYSGIIE